MATLKEIVLPGSVKAFTDYLKEVLDGEPKQCALVLGVDEETPRVVSNRARYVVVVDRDERKLTEEELGWEESNIAGVVGDVESLPMSDESVDLVVGRHFVHLVPSAAQEAIRVLKEEGEAYFSVPIGFGLSTERKLESMDVDVDKTEPLSHSWNPLARGTVFVIEK